MHRLYCPTLGTDDLTLSEEEIRHVRAVLRLTIGKNVVLFDGAGREAAGHIVAIGRREVRVEAGEITCRPFDLTRRVTLAVAVPRIHRQGYLVEKCTELGVSALWPILTDRGVVKPETGAADKWTRRAVEAAKQSERAFVPVIEPPQPFSRALERYDEFHAVGIAHARDRRLGILAFLQTRAVDSSILVFVGPEGGWSDSEWQAANDRGAALIGLGPTILRTETAAIAVCAAAAMLDEDRKAPLSP